ncbi:zinc finger protein 98 [Anopheles moucheti]|uniref:zinc finger protein 98 n=1 Tax=Anopheles moucheti TaxID=186751 RepID=UPI0022F0B37F|nr:zinc finger protein 98 [Anopheles moucheti]XP_052888659.1 zinc finger protein 98 [Anopheles moucheti]
MDATDSTIEQVPLEGPKTNWQYYTDNFHRLCRLCLSQDRLVSIYYNVQGRNVYYIRNFVKLALDLLKIKINKHDALPNFLCEKCERNLKIITNFKRKCDESMKLLCHIRDSTNKRDHSKPVPDAVRKRKRRRKVPTKKLKEDCADILKKLPQEIHVEKKAITLIEKRVKDSTDSSTNFQIPYEEKNKSIAVIIEAIDQRNLECLETKTHDQLSPESLNEDQPAGHQSNDEEIEFITTDEYFDEQEENEDRHETPNISHQNDPTSRNPKHKQIKTSPHKEKIVCSVCGTKVNNIKSHMVIHSVRTHKCEQCPKSFTSRNKLQSHVNGVHLRKRDFKCDICDKAFLEKNNLKGHMRIHNGERKYACNLCPKTFLFAGTLRCHMLTHTQEKRHECEVCGKLFLLRTTLNKHLRVHSGEKPHSCSVCDKRFRTTTHMVVHMRTHTGEKPLSCRICGMCFAHHKGRSVHMKTKHPQQLVELGLIDEKGHLKC